MDKFQNVLIFAGHCLVVHKNAEVDETEARVLHRDQPVQISHILEQKAGALSCFDQHGSWVLRHKMNQAFTQVLDWREAFLNAGSVLCQQRGVSFALLVRSCVREKHANAFIIG